MGHVHVIHERGFVGILGCHFRVRETGSRPVQRIVDHVLPVLMSAVAIVVMAGFARGKVGQTGHYRVSIAVLQVRRAVAGCTTGNIRGGLVSIRISRSGGAEERSCVRHVIVQMHVRARRDFGSGPTLVLEQGTAGDVTVNLGPVEGRDRSLGGIGSLGSRQNILAIVGTRRDIGETPIRYLMQARAVQVLPSRAVVLDRVKPFLVDGRQPWRFEERQTVVRDTEIDGDGIGAQAVRDASDAVDRQLERASINVAIVYFRVGRANAAVTGRTGLSLGHIDLRVEIARHRCRLTRVTWLTRRPWWPNRAVSAVVAFAAG